jgi:hypothetical protein
MANEAWFNLLFSLPSIYQPDILAQSVTPLLFQRIQQLSLASSLTIINNEANQVNANSSNESAWFTSLFANTNELDNVSSLLFASKLNNKVPGLHIIYFKDNQTSSATDKRAHNKVANKGQYQFELFVDALLLAQKQKQQKDIVWVSSIGNQSNETRLNTKPALFIYPEKISRSPIEVSFNTSNMDLQPTIMKHWLDCDISQYTNGTDVALLNKDRIIANTTDNGIIAFDKDKSVFVDQNGNFQSYSRKLSAPITVDADFPLMIDGVQFIKKYTQQAQPQTEN